MIFKKVRFQGEEYWYTNKDMFFCEAVLAPLSHYSEDGELLANPLTDISFAIIEGNNIVRFYDVIGTLSDLEDVINDKETTLDTDS